MVTSDITVKYPATLTIEPGVTVLFNSGTGLKLGLTGRACLSAKGTANAPILFTSASGDTGDWKGLLFDDYSDYAVSELSHCIIEKAGQPNQYGISANIYCRRTNTPVINNCTIQSSSGYGIYLATSSPNISNSEIRNSSSYEVVYLDGSSSNFTNNTIIGNGGAYWLYCIDKDSNPVLINNTFQGNAIRALRLGTNFQMSGNTFVNANDKRIEVWGGEIKDSKIWSKQQGIAKYEIVNNQLNVYNTSTIVKAVLQIEPGISIFFNSGTGLKIGDDYYSGPGALIAEGNSSNPIIFTSASGNSEDWKGILFDDGSDNNTSTNMTYCTIENAGQPNEYGIAAEIYCWKTTTPFLNHCTIRSGNNYGMALSQSSPNLVSNEFIASNSLYWIYSFDHQCSPVLTGNRFSGTVKKALRFGPNFQTNDNTFVAASDKAIEIWGGVLNQIRIWSKQSGLSVYEIVNNDLKIQSGGFLTINPGLCILFNNSTGLRVGGTFSSGGAGTLIAEGSRDEPIRFSSASGGSGDWRGILFDDWSDRVGTSRMDYCIVENAGQNFTKTINASIYLSQTNTPLRNCTIQDNLSTNTMEFYKSSPVLSRCKVINNAGKGIVVGYYSAPVIGDTLGNSCDIYGNGGYDLYNGSSKNVYARHNYWGTIDENQINSHIFDKSDNSGMGIVYFKPFANEPGGGNQPPTVFSLLSPPNNSVAKTLTPTLIWQKSIDPDGASDPLYTLQVGLHPDFLKDYYEFYNINDETYTLGQSLADQTQYYWRVKATDEDSASTWSNEIWSFFINSNTTNHPPFSPSVLLPVVGEELKLGDYLVWTESTDPDLGDSVSYVIELDDDQDFSSPEIHQGAILAENNADKIESVEPAIENLNANSVYIRLITLHDYINLQDDSTYYWRVKAVDNHGGQSDFTDGASHLFFNKTNTAPNAVTEGFSPRDGLEVRTVKPEISWYPANDPDKSDHAGTLLYNLQLDDDGEFANNVKLQFKTSAGLNTYEIPNALTENAQWYYRVQAEDDGGLTSNWSTVQNFWVNAVDEPPQFFEIVSPADNFLSQSDTVVFVWQTTSDPDPFDSLCYVLEWSTEQNFASLQKIVLSKEKIQCDFIRPDGVQEIYWKLKAKDSDNLVRYASKSDESPRRLRWNPTGVFGSEELPKDFALYQNYPNPFPARGGSAYGGNPETTINFQLPSATQVIIKIFNLNGAEIRTLIDKKYESGFYNVVWDGKNRQGINVPSGVYLYQIQAGNYRQVRKMLLLH